MIKKLSVVIDELTHASAKARRKAQHWLDFAKREHAEKLYEKALDRFDDGNKTRAASELKEIINTFPDTDAAQRAQEFLDDEY